MSFFFIFSSFFSKKLTVYLKHLYFRPKKRKRKITKSEVNEQEEKPDEEVAKPEVEV